MLELIVVSIIIFLLVLVTEILWRSKHYSNELTRKFIHISLGTFAAFWPWFLSWNQIYILAGGAKVSNQRILNQEILPKE